MCLIINLSCVKALIMFLDLSWHISTFLHRRFLLPKSPSVCFQSSWLSCVWTPASNLFLTTTSWERRSTKRRGFVFPECSCRANSPNPASHRAPDVTQPHTSTNRWTNVRLKCLVDFGWWKKSVFLETLLTCGWHTLLNPPDCLGDTGGSGRWRTPPTTNQLLPFVPSPADGDSVWTETLTGGNMWNCVNTEAQTVVPGR